MEHAVVTQLIETAKGQATDPLERALLALNAFPVPWAWEGCYGIRANGEVIYVDDDGKPQPLESIGRVRLNTLATLVYAAKRNPDLRCLLPQRPRSASPCRACGGAGIVARPDLLCGECAGLGWLDAA